MAFQAGEKNLWYPEIIDAFGISHETLRALGTLWSSIQMVGGF